MTAVIFREEFLDGGEDDPARGHLDHPGRRPRPERRQQEREALAARLRRIRGPQGEAWATHIIKPNEYYADLRGDYPDLMVYFDDLYWRSAGTLGWGTMFLAENDTGPDDAVHAQYGMYILHDPRAKASVRKDIDITDVAPSILKILGLPVPKDMKGEPIL